MRLKTSKVDTGARATSKDSLWDQGKDMRAVDCFCASGGLTCGLEAAGFDVAMGIDVDRAALRLYRARHAHPAIELDLSDVSRAVQMIREVGPIDLLAGSPPCTDFSSAGHREEKRLTPPRCVLRTRPLYRPP